MVVEKSDLSALTNQKQTELQILIHIPWGERQNMSDLMTLYQVRQVNINDLIFSNDQCIGIIIYLIICLLKKNEFVRRSDEFHSFLQDTVCFI